MTWQSERRGIAVTIPILAGLPTIRRASRGATTPSSQVSSKEAAPGSARAAFKEAPELTAPAAGPPPGLSLSANPHGDGPPINPDQVIPPTSRPIAPNKQVAPFTGGTSTDATFPPPSGRPWWLPILGPIGLGAAAVGAGIAGINDENQPGNVPAHGTGPPDVMSPEEIYRRQHPGAPAPAGTPNFVRPEGEVPRTYPMWPTPPAPCHGGAAAISAACLPGWPRTRWCDRLALHRLAGPSGSSAPRHAARSWASRGSAATESRHLWRSVHDD